MPTDRTTIFEHAGDRMRQGFIDDYAGARVTATGREFRIERATVWNLVDAADAIGEQAARFDAWRWL